MNYKNYIDLSNDILHGVRKLNLCFDVVIGIPRSGMVPAYMIGNHLNLPVISLDSFITGNKPERGKRVNKTDQLICNALVVDDSIYSGEAFKKAKKKLMSYNSQINYHFLAVYASKENHEEINTFFEIVPQPRVFQWNYKNHFIATKSCYDIDGVLCVDPNDLENDDGENYKIFLENAVPLFIPTSEISCIVTSRLEKYREETEKWLFKNNVLYKELIMLNMSSANERRQKKIHGKFKAEVFKKRNEQFFIESNWRQAIEIHMISGKPVFCTENDILINDVSDTFSYDDSKLRRSTMVVNKIKKMVKSLMRF